MNTNNLHFESLTPAVFYILLALSRQDLHGYGIMKQVAEDSKGTIKMGPGTLYGTIQRMLKDNLIEEAETPKNEPERRRYYRITSRGRKVLSLELTRYESAVKVAKVLKLLPHKL